MNNTIRNILVAVFVFLAAVVGFILVTNSQMLPSQSDQQAEQSQESNESVSEAVDIKASFLIFTNGTKRTFADTMYHNLSNDVYIESALNPTIVNVTKSGITWNDFFKTLPFELDTECLVTGTGQKFCDGNQEKLTFYLNGVEESSLLQKEIQSGDQALITFGNESEEQIKKQFEQIPEP